MAVVNSLALPHTNSINAAVLDEARERSRSVHRLDPHERRVPLLATQCEIAQFRGSSEEMLRAAGEEIDRLHAGLSHANCAVLLAGPQAVILDHRITPGSHKDFIRHGSWTGGDWSESVEGTNGVGTATFTKRAVMVRGDEHYNHRNNQFTCLSVPVHAPTGRFAGSLTVARPVPDVTPAVVMAMSFAREAAAAIEQRQFRAAFFRYWIAMMRPLQQSHPVLMFAVDRDRRIVGAGHNARMVFDLSDECIEEGIGFDALFEGTPDCLGRMLDEQAPRIVSDRGGDQWQVLVTPPAKLSRGWLGGGATKDPTRPRWLRADGALTMQEKEKKAALSPHALKRVVSHIDAHLDEALPLEELAVIARLRRSHFSDAFRGSTGVSPHRFVLQRRIENAKKMLADLRFNVTDVALACGFASASHFATAFRAATGSTPRDYRATQGLALAV